MLAKDLLDLGKMAELEKTLKIKKAKPRCALKRTRGTERILDWSKLEEGFCPRCGFSLDEIGDTFKCKFDDFSISKEKMVEIQKRIEDEKTFAFPDQIDA